MDELIKQSRNNKKALAGILGHTTPAPHQTKFLKIVKKPKLREGPPQKVLDLFKELN